MKNIRYFIVGFSALIMLSACQNTVQGFGQDLENAGEKIQGKKETSNAPAPARDTTYSTNSTTYDSGTTYSTSTNPTYGDVY